MADTIRLELVTPERQLLSEDVEEVIVPGVEGDLGILPGHAALLSALRVGEMAYRKGGQLEYIAIEGGGLIEVSADKVIVLADAAELGREINLEEAIERKLNAEKALKDERQQDAENFRNMEVKLKVELTRIDIAERYK
ncbi:F0F1 ATP synthase subunit epsilon [Limisalsivibrio acetivorans]|uniref:F0F1 ATP synthase subunit epsilon n=1 Tax=Limisalsivibrio acetivorans TaxID=1304888 RepID=UPI0003B604C8|nr:F0F1 ATP synthase subunit epsilon [Limisalsivibrio acetivorans]